MVDPDKLERLVGIRNIDLKWRGEDKLQDRPWGDEDDVFEDL